MKRTLEILLIGLMAGGLLTGCPKKGGDEGTETNSATAEQAENNTTAEEPAETTAEVEEEPEVDQENYANALFEVSCVRAQVEDTEQQKTIIDEVYARYGFDGESFAAAQTAMAGKADIDAALKSKMEKCTPELAAGFAKAGEEAGTNGATNAGEEDKKEEVKKAPAKSWKSGGFADNGVTGGGLEMGKLRINITDEGKVTGAFQGKREGKGFSIPLKGEISKDGSFKASGNKGPNNARVNGRYKSNTLTGAIQGSINKKGYRVNFTAK